MPKKPKLDTPTQDTKAKRREKCLRACDWCRKGKVRCEGSSPCQRCLTKNLECTFSYLNSSKRAVSTPEETVASPTPTKKDITDLLLNYLQTHGSATCLPQNFGTPAIIPSSTAESAIHTNTPKQSKSKTLRSSSSNHSVTQHATCSSSYTCSLKEDQLHTLVQFQNLQQQQMLNSTSSDVMNFRDGAVYQNIILSKLSNIGRKEAYLADEYQYNSYFDIYVKYIHPKVHLGEPCFISATRNTQGTILQRSLAIAMVSRCIGDIDNWQLFEGRARAQSVLCQQQVSWDVLQSYTMLTYFFMGQDKGLSEYYRSMAFTTSLAIKASNKRLDPTSYTTLDELVEAENNMRAHSENGATPLRMADVDLFLLTWVDVVDDTQLLKNAHSNMAIFKEFFHLAYICGYSSSPSYDSAMQFTRDFLRHKDSAEQNSSKMQESIRARVAKEKISSSIQRGYITYSKDELRSWVFMMLKCICLIHVLRHVLPEFYAKKYSPLPHMEFYIGAAETLFRMYAPDAMASHEAQKSTVYTIPATGQAITRGLIALCAGDNARGHSLISTAVETLQQNRSLLPFLRPFSIWSFRLAIRSCLHTQMFSLAETLCDLGCAIGNSTPRMKQILWDDLMTYRSNQGLKTPRDGQNGTDHTAASRNISSMDTDVCMADVTSGLTRPKDHTQNEFLEISNVHTDSSQSDSTTTPTSISNSRNYASQTQSNMPTSSLFSLPAYHSTSGNSSMFDFQDMSQMVASPRRNIHQSDFMYGVNQNGGAFGLHRQASPAISQEFNFNGFDNQMGEMSVHSPSMPEIDMNTDFTGIQESLEEWLGNSVDLIQ